MTAWGGLTLGAAIVLVGDEPRGSLRPVSHPQLREHVTDVVGDGLPAQEEPLLDHHAERLEKTYAAAAPDADTAAQVAQRLLWTRRGRSFDDLSMFDRMLAILETRAHLDVLVDRGRLLVHRDEDGIDRYAST